MAPSGWMRATGAGCKVTGETGKWDRLPWDFPRPSWTLCQGFPPICGEGGKFGGGERVERSEAFERKPDDWKFPTSPTRLKLPSSEVAPHTPFIVLAWMAISR